MERNLHLITSKTNRHFYVRHKKSSEEPFQPNIGKVLKSLVKRQYHHNNLQHSITNRVRKTLITENQDDAATIHNSKYSQCDERRKQVQALLKKMHPGWRRLLRCFQKMTKSQTMELLEANQLDFYETLSEIALIELEKTKTKSINGLKEFKENKLIENAVLFQNARLEKENDLLKDQLINGRFAPDQIEGLGEEKGGTMGAPWKNNKEETLDYGKVIIMERKLQLKGQEVQILKREIQSSKEELFLAREEKKSLQERINELKCKNQNLCSEVISLQIKNKTTGFKNEAIMVMQKEEVDSYMREVQDLRKLYLNMHKKYKSLLTKFKRAKSDNNCKMAVLENKQSICFPQQYQAFEEIKFKFLQFMRFHLDTLNYNRKQIGTSANLGSTSQNIPSGMNIYQPFLNNKESMNNREAIKRLNKKNIVNQYLTPSFYFLISEDINFFGIDQNNFEHFNQNIKLSFLATLRAILDCKFNEFEINRSSDSHPLGTSFPSFVLGWLNTFMVNNQKKIESHSLPARELVCGFYANLMSQKLNNSWQIVSFREFLFQTVGIDQLYFYLALRFRLLDGDISQNLDYAFEEIYYVDLAKAYSLTTKCMREQDYEYKKIIEEFLKRSVVYIRKKAYIDLHYLLRVALEYYQSIKQKQIEKIAKTLDVVVLGKKSNLTYSDFSKIFDYHFQFLSITEKIQLYRKCYCVGNSNVNQDAIFTILNQEGIFLKWVQEEIFTMKEFRLQEVGHEQSMDDGQISPAESEKFLVVPDLQWLANCERNFRFVYKSQVQRECMRMGVVDILHKVRRKYNLSGDNIFARLQEIIKICLFVCQKRMKSQSHQQGYDEIEEVISLTSNFVQDLSKCTLRRNEISQLMRDLKIEGACDKIVRFYQKKKAQMTRSILYAYTKNVMTQQEEARNNVIRTQFMNIIESMKSRKKITDYNKELQ